MKKFIKVVFTITLLILLMSVFSSSYLSLSIDNLAYVLAMGIDKSDVDKLQVTFQFSTTESSSESGSTEKSKSIVKVVDASSLSSAINLMDSYFGKKLNLSHCKAIIFSEELAYEGISDEIFTLINDTQIRPSSNIIISQCSAKYYIENTKPELESLLSKYYEIFDNSSSYTGYIPKSAIGDFFNSLIRKTSDPYAISGNVNNEQSENIGVAVFSGDKFTGRLSPSESIAFLTIQKKINRFLISVPDPIDNSKYVDIYISPENSRNITVDTSSSSPYLKLKLSFKGRIYSMTNDSNYLSTDVLNTLSETCNRYLKSEISSLLYKTSRTFKSDICGLGKYALSNFLTEKDFDEYNWLYNYKNAFFDVDIDTTIKSSLLITET